MRDMMGLMKQAQAMQAKLAEVQTQLDTLTVEGQSGGGMVKITLTAKGAMKSVNLDPALLKADEKEMLEDLILAAFEDARRRAEETAQEKVREVTAGLPLPPGMKLF